MKITGKCGYHNVDLVVDSRFETAPRALFDEIDLQNDHVFIDLRGVFACPALTEEEEDNDLDEKCYESYSFTITPQDTERPYAQDVQPPALALG